MSRSITISADVFAAIWAERQEGEETEDEILRRLFACLKANGEEEIASDPNGSGGVYDVRNNVHFPEAFEVFRTYKNREYRAEVHNGVWVRQDTGEQFPTLNKLNRSITPSRESVWNGAWRYITEDGSNRSIHVLRLLASELPMDV